nr:hypothetical protein CFP56_52845 [Quercus suber]
MANCCSSDCQSRSPVSEGASLHSGAPLNSRPATVTAITVHTIGDVDLHRSVSKCLSLRLCTIPRIEQQHNIVVTREIDAVDSLSRSCFAVFKNRSMISIGKDNEV